MTPYWLALAGAVVFGVSGQILLKLGVGVRGFLAQLFDPRTILGLGLYGLSAMFYIVALRRLPMSVALPCTAASYVVVLLVGHFVFAEAVGITQIAAVGLICAGVLLLAVSA